MVHEAGVKWFNRWLKWDENQIRTFREECLTYFREEMGVSNIAAAYSSEPAEHQLDLGTGNFITPYTVFKGSKHRIGAAYFGPDIACIHGRIHEGGFKVEAGRAGLKSSRFGFLEYGTIIQKGYYVIECEDRDEKIYIEFQDVAPMKHNNMVFYDVVQDLYHQEWGTGLLTGLHSVLPTRSGQTKIDSRFTMSFNSAWDNV